MRKREGTSWTDVIGNDFLMTFVSDSHRIRKFYLLQLQQSIKQNDESPSLYWAIVHFLWFVTFFFDGVRSLHLEGLTVCMSLSLQTMRIIMAERGSHSSLVVRQFITFMTNSLHKKVVLSTLHVLGDWMSYK